MCEPGLSLSAKTSFHFVVVISDLNGSRRRGRRRIRRRRMCLCNFLIEFRRLFPIQWICRCGSKHLAGNDICEGDREMLVTMVEFRFGRLSDGKKEMTLPVLMKKFMGCPCLLWSYSGFSSSWKVNVCLVLLAILQIPAKVKCNLLHVWCPMSLIVSNSGFARVAFC